MKREQAVAILKQILEGSSYAYYKSITLLLHPKNGLSKGYQIQLESRNNEIMESHLLRIAKENNLAVVKNGSLWIIYRPREIVTLHTLPYSENQIKIKPILSCQQNTAHLN